MCVCVHVCVHVCESVCVECVNVSVHVCVLCACVLARTRAPIDVSLLDIERCGQVSHPSLTVTHRYSIAVGSRCRIRHSPLLNRGGQVLHVQMDEANVIKFLQGQLQNLDLAMKVAARAKLPGAEQLYSANFDQLLRSGDVAAAAEMAAKSPNGKSSVM